MTDRAIPRAVLDTNVLFPPMLRDMLLYLARAGLFRMVWSIEIVGELRRNLIKVAHLPPNIVSRRIGWMTDAFPLTAAPSPSETVYLPGIDPKDQHIAALAIWAGAVIVTANLRAYLNRC